MLLLNSSWGSGKTLFFLVGAKKITSKQWLFDKNKNIVLVFLFDGAVRPHESEKNDGCFSRIYGIPFGEKGSRLEPETFWSGTEKKKPGMRDTAKHSSAE